MYVESIELKKNPVSSQIWKKCTRVIAQTINIYFWKNPLNQLNWWKKCLRVWLGKNDTRVILHHKIISSLEQVEPEWSKCGELKKGLVTQ